MPSRRPIRGGSPLREQLDVGRDPRVLETAIEHSRDAIIVTTADLDWPGPRIIYANPSFTTLTGYSLQEVIGKTPRILQGPKTDRAVLRRLREQLERGESFMGEAVNYRKDGSAFVMEWSVTPVRDESGAIREYVAVQRDVTARHQGEASTRFFERANQALAESIHYDVTLKTVAQLPVPALADVCAVYSLSDESTSNTFLLCRQSCSATKAANGVIKMPKELGPIARTGTTSVASTLRTGKPIPSRTFPAELLAAGTPRSSRSGSVSQPMPTLLLPMIARSRPIGIIVFVRTDSKHVYDADDVALAMGLTSRCALAIDNALAYRQVQRAVTMRDSVLALVSHDLKSPLTVISGQTQTLLRLLARSAPVDRGRLVRSLESINRSVVKSSSLIDELLDAARMQAGKPLPLHLQPCDLVELARQEVSDRQATNPDIEIDFEASVPSLIGQWDNARLARVVGNMLSNAIKYSRPEQSIEVRVDRRDTPAGIRACLTVRDHGIGIPTPDLSRIFEPFHRASNVIGRYSGTGLGLAGSKYIVESMDGTIEAQSVEGKGSTFIVCLPLVVRANPTAVDA